MVDIVRTICRDCGAPLSETRIRHRHATCSPCDHVRRRLSGYTDAYNARRRQRWEHKGLTDRTAPCRHCGQMVTVRGRTPIVVCASCRRKNQRAGWDKAGRTSRQRERERRVIEGRATYGPKLPPWRRPGRAIQVFFYECANCGVWFTARRARRIAPTCSTHCRYKVTYTPRRSAFEVCHVCGGAVPQPPAQGRKVTICESCRFAKKGGPLEEVVNAWEASKRRTREEPDRWLREATLALKLLHRLQQQAEPNVRSRIQASRRARTSRV